MLKFKEDEYRNSMKLICEARVDAERAADELSKRGYKIFSLQLLVEV